MKRDDVTRCQRHSVTQATPSPPIPTARRHPRAALPTNLNGAAPTTRHAPHQPQRHSATPCATHATPSPPIPMAQPCEHITNTSRTARTHSRKLRRNRSKHGPAPRPPLKGKNPSLRIPGEKKQNEPTNPDALQKNVKDSCQRMWHIFLSATLVNYCFQTRVNDFCQRLCQPQKMTRHDMT